MSVASPGPVVSPRRAPRPKPETLWRDLRGRTTYRVLGAATLDELCAGSGLKTADILRRVRFELRRPLSRQTLSAWRRGDQPIPNEVLLAVATVVNRTISDARLACAIRAMADPESHPDFVALVRRYYAHDSVRPSVFLEGRVESSGARDSEAGTRA